MLPQRAGTVPRLRKLLESGMPIRSKDEVYESLLPIMAKYGAQGDAVSFFRAVNEIFHDQEAQVYDAIHPDMWAILPQQFELLASDVSTRSNRELPRAAIDIGCGTGLAFHLFSRTHLGQSIREVCLLDTSTKMLDAARARSNQWGSVRSETVLGTLSNVPGEARFDVALASSVLHHVPDLPGFFSELDRVLKPGALFFHLQDQNDDADAATLEQRRARLRPANSPKAHIKAVLQRLGLLEVLVGLKEAFSGRRGRTDSYIEGTNRELIARGIIGRPMSAQDIWTVTDVHIGDRVGLSIAEMRRILPKFELLSVRTYNFFGEYPLPENVGLEEQRLIGSRDLNGSRVAAVWRKR